MIAKQAGQMVAKFIEKSWPNDREEVYEILTLALNRAWNEGKWLGMTAEFFVPYEEGPGGDKFIIAPTSHPILLAVNVNGKPTTIRDNYFAFHKNGMGTIINNSECKWSQDVTDYGTIPIINKNNINFKCGVRIGVRALGSHGEGESIIIGGQNVSGGAVYTYKQSTFGSPCGCRYNPQERVETIKGIELEVRDGFHYISNVLFYDIKSIAKTITRSPIEVIAIDIDGNATVIARMEPNQTESKYRKYLIPHNICKGHCIHGLFKIAQQDHIVNDSETLIINNMEAIMAFTMGVYMLYYKQNAEAGAGYILTGITILEKQRREEDSPSEFPVQVTGLMVDDVPEVMKYLH
jgi:hypothetical protein